MNKANSEREHSFILMSLKPVYSDLILDGLKKYEFRRRIFSKSEGNVLMYATKPIGKVVGYFNFDRVLKGIPQEIWEKCQYSAGVTKVEFFRYFANTEVAYAIKINEVFKFQKPLDINEISKGSRAPRSFNYINTKILIH